MLAVAMGCVDVDGASNREYSIFDNESQPDSSGRNRRINPLYLESGRGEPATFEFKKKNTRLSSKLLTQKM